MRKEGFWVLTSALLVSTHHLSTHLIKITDKSDYFMLKGRPSWCSLLPFGGILGKSAKKWGWMSKHHISDPPEPSLQIRSCSADQWVTQKKGKLRNNHLSSLPFPSFWSSTHCSGPRERWAGSPRSFPREHPPGRLSLWQSTSQARGMTWWWASIFTGGNQYLTLLVVGSGVTVYLVPCRLHLGP